MFVKDFDKLGFCASVICAVHCVIAPVVVLYSGTFGLLAFLDNELLEVGVLTLTCVIGVVAILPAYRKHRQFYVIMLFLAGLLLIVNSEFVHDIWISVPLSTAGAGIIGYSHFENQRLGRSWQ